ncbi:hypothetical protein SAMN02927924_01131 [Sphingobium faniae]|nr:hypothetical protein SAMN02927924_01131 [Sphingobium faniae]
MTVTDQKPLRFDGRVAIVTGAGRGLGRAHAMMLASLGCKVVVNDLGVKSTGAHSGEDPAANVVSEITALGGMAVADNHNVVTQAQDLIATAMDAFGRLDIVINNAGVLNDAFFGEMASDDWHAGADVHLKGTVEVCRAAWPHLKKSDAARVLNTSSSGMLGTPGSTSYGAAKGGVYGFTRNLALDGRLVGINVNGLMPTGWTRMTAAITDPAVVETLQNHFQPERVAAFVAWLVHPDTDVSNEVFRVSGLGASRVIMGTTETTFAREPTADAWRDAARFLMMKTALVPLHTTMLGLVRDIQEIAPEADVSQMLEDGCIGLEMGAGD